MVETCEFVVPAEEAGTRLDVFLVQRLPGWTRSQVQRLIRQGQVRVSSPATAGSPALARKAGEEIGAGDRIRVRAEREAPRAAPEAWPLSILYEDDDLIAVDKPAGMVVHLGAGVKSGTLVNALLHHTRGLSSLGGELRPGIVHRLDRMTSGVMVIAKNDSAHQSLAEQFKSHAVRKTYLLLVHGLVKEPEGVVERPVGRDPRRRVRMKAGGLRARSAVTRYRVLRRFRYFTFVEARPETGRTHQLRVHFASLGHPVVGDTLYGAPSRIPGRGGEARTLARNFLHASGIEFRHPRTGQPLRLSAPLPAELEDFLKHIE